MSKVNHAILFLFSLLKVKGHYKVEYSKVIFDIFVRI